ncbi:MAG TPA: outer membrane beta-barrel protein [Pyrinomonadaceae bacterium]|nr:outer membrane beta-barrel protein [Pyrinomonadaceae bacterium]
MRRVICAACLTALLLAGAGPPASAQEGVPRVEVFGGYSWAGGDFHGWGASVNANVNRWLGLTADFSGHYSGGEPGPVRERQRAQSYLFGPRVSLRRKRTTAFAYALFGGVNFRDEVSAPALGFSGTFSDRGFNMALGGGLDVNVTRRVAIRAFQLDYMRPTFFGEAHDRGRLAFGLVLRLGRK